MQLQPDQIPPGVVTEELRLKLVLKQAEISEPALISRTVTSRSSVHPPIP